MKTMRGNESELKSEMLEPRLAPLTIATTEPVLDQRPIDTSTTDGGNGIPTPPCTSPKAGSRRGPIVYQDLTI